MAKDKKPKEPKAETPKKLSEEDLDKTTLDIDIRQLDGFEETVMVKVPPPEDSDLHEIEYFDTEKTGEHDIAPPDPATSAADPSMEATGFFSMSDLEEEGEPQAKAPPPPVKPVAKPSAPEKPAPAAAPAAAGPVTGQVKARPQRSWLYLLLSVLLFIFLAEGLVEVLSRGAGLRLPAIFATAVAALFFIGALLRRLEGRTGFLGILLAWFGLVAWAGFHFGSTDPANLHFFKTGLATWMGPFWVLVLGIVFVVLAATPRLSFLAKALTGIALLLGGLALTFAYLGGQSFEAGIWGPAYLSKLPLWLRPGVMTLTWSFPLCILAVLLAWVFRRKSGEPFLRRGGWALLAIGVVGSLLGLKLLARQGMKVPGFSFLTQESFFGATLLDPRSSPIRLQVAQGPAVFNAPIGMPLRLAATRSGVAGKERQSRLLVRNQEGLSFAPGLKGHLVLSRGDKAISGVRVEVDSARLGAPRDLLLVFDLPSLIQTEVKSSTVSAIIETASLMQAQDRLHLVSGTAAEILLPKNNAVWEKQIEKVLASANAPADLSASMKKLAGAKGLKQAIWIGEVGKLAPGAARDSWKAEASKQKAVLSFVTLGAGGEVGTEIFSASAPAELGFEILSAAAETWGDAILKFPALAPLPKLHWVKDENGQAQIRGGKIEFEIQAEDTKGIRSLTLQVDEEKARSLPADSLRQAIDLAGLKIKPGAHRLKLSLTTSEGDVVSESLEMQYVARRPLRFIKPMDKDTVSGNFNIMLLAGKSQGLEAGSLELSVDGLKVGQVTSEPYLIPLDTRVLSEGPHTLQVVQTYSDGSSESQQIQVSVHQQAPVLQILRPSNGEYLSNLGDIEAQVGGGLFEQIQKVEFLVDGEWIGESLQAPYRFLWDNHAFPTGNYFIQARAYLGDQSTVSDAVAVQLGQGEIAVQADPALSSSGMLFPDKVEVLIDASAGMNQPVGSAFKIDLAKAAMSGLLAALPQNSQLNARVLGSKSRADQHNCTDIQIVKSASGALDALQARGVFSLSHGLELLEKDLKKSPGSRVGLLIAGAWDQCGGDPIAVASRIAKQGERIRLHVVYFSDVDPTTESLFKRLAEVMGGRTYKVARQEDLERAIGDAVQVNFSLYDFKNTAVVDQPLSQKAIQVRAGEYRLEVDTSPPALKSQIQIPAGGRKALFVIPVDGKYEIREE